MGAAAFDRARFVLRCVAAAVLGYAAARAVGLPHPVWAPMSALIVLQPQVSATITSVGARLLGTALGVAAALLVHWLMPGVALIGQIGVAVGLCAVVASAHPAIRVALWTGPLLLVAADQATVAALARAAEVMLGAATGALVHLGEDAGLAPPLRRLLVPAKE